MSEEKEETRRQKCRYSHPDIFRKGIRYHCSKRKFKNGDWKPVSEKTCNNCELYKSQYIEYPITVNKVEHTKINYNSSWRNIGCLVAVRPCDEKYGGKTFLGFYIGDLPLFTSVSFNEEDGILKTVPFTNPAIFVPELKEIIFGCGSWWREIKKPEDFKEITDTDISNTWYVQLAKKMMEENKTE